MRSTAMWSSPGCSRHSCARRPKEQWPAVREFLKDRGVDPDRAAVGDVFPDQGLFIIVAAEDGRAFELTTWFEPDDETNYVIESWHELAGDGRHIHTGALYGAFALLSEETEGVADPVEILVETVERTTRELRHEDDWRPLRQAMLEAGVDPRRAILVDWVHSLAVDAPPERRHALRRWEMVRLHSRRRLTCWTHGAGLDVAR
jgi:hypothetical protein